MQQILTSALHGSEKALEHNGAKQSEKPRLNKTSQLLAVTISLGELVNAIILEKNLDFE